MYKRITRNKEGEVIITEILSDDGKILSTHIGEIEKSYEYDEQGQLIKTKNFYGDEESYEYDDKGNKIKYKYPSGYEEFYEYEEIKE